jgi:hypothetical protein
MYIFRTLGKKGEKQEKSENSNWFSTLTIFSFEAHEDTGVCDCPKRRSYILTMFQQNLAQKSLFCEDNIILMALASPFKFRIDNVITN